MLDHSNISGVQIFAGLAALVVLSSANSLFQRFGRNPKLKRGVFVGHLVVFTIAFLGFVLLVSGQPAALLAAVPVAAFYVATQLIRTRICSVCGQTVISRQWLSGAASCPACNANLGRARRSHT